MSDKTNYKKLYRKLLDDIINNLHELRYSYDNRIREVGDQSLELMIKEYQKQRFSIEG